ncbi:uncharacterized protein LOC143289519 [Babylonia areolata]|uniref:uncharacterized protein LOC143289519 n=1 Tax=Babylonia areolata TaxID=304850 RepID=UPI003FD436DB
MRQSVVLFAICLLLHVTDSDVEEKSDVSAGDVTASPGSEVQQLRAEVKKLRRSFLRFKRGGGRGKGKLCEEATSKINDAISLELSGLRTQLHTSDSVKSLRSELEYGLTSLRSELDNKVTSLRAELETGLTAVRSEVQAAVSEIKTEVNSELTDVRAELQYNLNAACSGDKDLTKAVAELQGSLQGLRSELDSRIATSRAELEQKMMGVRSELEGGMTTVQSQFKTDVVSVRSDLQDMVSDVRTEMQDSMAGTRSELQTGFTAAQSGLQNSLHALQADVMGVTSKAAGDMASLKAEISGVSAVVKAEVQVQLSETSAQVKQALKNLEEDQHEQLTHLSDRLQHLASQHSHLAYNTSTLTQGLDQVKKEAEKGLEALRSDLDQQLQKHESRLDQVVNNFLFDVDSADSKDSPTPEYSNLTDLEHRLTSMQTGLAGLADLRADLDTKVGDLDRRVKDMESQRAAEAANSSQAMHVLEVSMNDLQEAMGSQLQKLQQDNADSGGSTYVRWGRTGCPDSAELVYSGVVGGSSYDTDGGAANRLCLTLTPQAGNVTGARTYIYGAEYKFSEHHDLDVVCALCRSPLPSTIMVPGTQTCPKGWRRQYAGHLTAGMVGHRAASQYLCLDGRPESRPGSQENRNGALFYYVFTECGSLPCPPYYNMYVSCVVCSR